MATPNQISYIESLLRDRAVPDELSGTTMSVLRTSEFTVTKASQLITSLLTLPRRPRDEVPAGPDRYAHLRGIEKSYYALTWEQLHDVDVADLAGDNRIAFFRVKPWKDRVYLDKLHGSWGGFTRTKLPHDKEIAVADLIRKDPQGAGLLFSKEYSVCARCGAELTDDRSRDTGYGPTCRGYMGL